MDRSTTSKQRTIRAPLSEGVPRSGTSSSSRPGTPTRSTLGSRAGGAATPTRAASPAAGKMPARGRTDLASSTSSTIRRPTNALTSSMASALSPPRAPASPSAGSAALRQEIMAARKRAAQARAAGTGGGRGDANVGEAGGVGVGSVGDGAGLGVESVAASGEEESWGMPSIEQAVKKAKTSGRLNIGSRSLKTLPAEIWTLLPPTSPFHPSNTRPSSMFLRGSGSIDFSITTHDDDETRWYEETELRYLNAGVNELQELGDALGGFTGLQTLDLHHNSLSSLPPSLGLLTSLTTLTLRHNHLSGPFPLPLLALSLLESLDISENSLASLWSAESWHGDVKVVMKTAVTKPVESVEERRGREGTVSPDQSVDSDDFHAFFPSSPTKPRRPLSTFSPRSSVSISSSASPPTAPFPNLKHLNLAKNRLTPSSDDPLPPLPTKLISLDLSGNPLGPKPLGLGPFEGLAALETLALADCGFGDDIFAPSRTEDGDSGTRSAFPALKTLDVSGNAIDTLAPIEALFGAEAGRRQVRYKGVPATLRKLVPCDNGDANAAERGLVVVDVKGNFLRDEGRRRRAMFTATAAPAKASLAEAGAKNDAPTAPMASATSAEDAETMGGGQAKTGHVETAAEGAEKLGWESELTEGEKRGRRAQAARLASAVAAPTLEATASSSSVTDVADAGVADDPALKLLLDRYNAAKRTMDLSGQNLSELPTPSTDSTSFAAHFDAAPVQTFDASRNKLSGCLSLSPLLTTGFAASLTTLRLARNRLTSLELPSASSGAAFPELKELDLSGNALTSTREGAGAGGLLELIAAMAPRLEVLDLSLNALTSDAGITALLAPGLLDPQADGEGGKPRKGLKVLRLGDNRVSEIEELARVGETFGRAKGEDKGWRCEELHLNNNEISKLPPSLGLLPSPPLQVLSVGGNPFRVPNRRIYEGAEGTKTLLAWLKDRC